MKNEEDKQTDRPTDGDAQDSATSTSRASQDQQSTDEATDAAPPSVESERDKLQDQLRRAMADLANIRKRHAKELDEARRRAIEALAAEILPVLDNFHLALAAHEQSAGDANDEVKNMLDGLVMVRSLLEGTLERHGLAEIEAAGVAFDPNVHEAVGVDNLSTAPAGTVTNVMQRGYRLGEKVLRAPRVVVAGDPAADSGGSADDATGDPQGDSPQG